MDREQFRKAGYAAIDRVCDYFEQLETLPVVSQVQPGEITAMLPSSAPQKGEPWSDIEADFDKVVLPGITHWQHPSFFSYFPANTTYESILGDIYAGAVSNPGFNWLCSPAVTELEGVVMDWVARMLGLDETFYNSSKIGGGVIMNSASDSALLACVAARERAVRLHPEVPRAELTGKLVIYATTQTHSLGAKAAIILGLPFRALETKAEDNWALRGATLKAALEEDAAKGLIPFITILTLGTTSTGAVDRIGECTAVAKSYPDLFIHVDAAWAGVFLACPELRAAARLDEINPALSALADGTSPSGQVHSFCTNLHKGGLVAFDASTFWIRDRKLLTEALDITPPFLRNRHSDEGTVVDYRNWQFSLGRRFRSLKVFFVLRSYGVEGFQAHQRRLIALAEELERLVAETPEFELFVPRQWSLVVVRLKSKVTTDPAKINELNQKFFEKIIERPDINLTPTTVGGSYCTRIAIGSPNTQEKHILHLWETIKEEAAATRLALNL